MYYIYRYDPVPLVHKFTYKSIYRKMKTTQESKISCDKKLQKYIRGKRRKANLPNNWDDYIRSDIRNKYSWKKNKKRKQWSKTSEKIIALKDLLINY